MKTEDPDPKQWWKIALKVISYLITLLLGGGVGTQL